MKLKKYQDAALEALGQFLSSARNCSFEDAWLLSMQAQQRQPTPYRAVFGNVPWVCLRVPTGGGKTMIGAHAIVTASKVWLENSAPIVVWLVPSDPIRSQTIEALSDIRHPYQGALEAAFPGRVRICSLEELDAVGVQDVGRKALVLVATIQAFRIKDTSLRDVYKFRESLDPHFQHLAPSDLDGLDVVTEADLVEQTFLTRSDLGHVKLSVVNWLAMHRPFLIVDEAHNAQTEKSIQSLNRIRPSAILELTATPVPGANVLHMFPPSS